MGQQKSTHSLQQRIDEDDEHYTLSNHQPNLMVMSNQYNLKERKIFKNDSIDLNLSDEWINKIQIKIKSILEQIKFDDFHVIILYIMNILMMHILLINIMKIMNNSRCSITRMFY